MKTYSNCCGGQVRRQDRSIKEPLPTNPQIRGGMQILFIGTGNIRVKGNGTGSVYYASDHRRHLKVYKEDSESFLSKKYFILKP